MVCLRRSKMLAAISLNSVTFNNQSHCCCVVVAAVVVIIIVVVVSLLVIVVVFGDSSRRNIHQVVLLRDPLASGIGND